MKLNDLNKTKVTENGDLAFTSPSNNKLLNILFLSEYYQKHLDELPLLGDSPREQLFAMFMRDPRFGLGRRDLGRQLLSDTECSIEQVIKCGRVDDLWHTNIPAIELTDYLYQECRNNNELVKKWMPRFGTKNEKYAKFFADAFFVGAPGCETNIQRKIAYGHLIKCNTVEQHLSRKETEKIVFEHVPSLAMLKYCRRFSAKPDTAKRFAEYLEEVKAGKKDLKVNTATCYDIYRNRTKIDPDLFFEKLPKVSGSWVPVIDSSGSMQDANDSYGKALAIGHYLAKTSTAFPDTAISFSSWPTLLKVGKDNKICDGWYHHTNHVEHMESQYMREIASLHTGDCSNTDLGRVMELLAQVDDLPEYLVILTDMEFDCGSSVKKDAAMRLWKEKGYKTKIIWWNLNSRHTTAPELDENGNIFMSGYNPTLLKFLEAGFDGEKFLNKLLVEYEKLIKE